jgi:hypothetical protein
MDDFPRSDRPFCRACIRSGKLTLNSWTPRLIRGGPMAMNMRTVRAALVDMFVVDGDELIVEPVPHSRFTGQDAEAITIWAQRVGYRRIWFPDQMIELEGEPAGGEAKVRCRSCGARWEDSSYKFWLRVRESGCFPGSCPACGDSLPEWDVAEPENPEDEVAQLDLWVQAKHG